MGSPAVAIPFIAKVAFGLVASKVVAKITGSDLLGMVAGLGAGAAFGPGGLIGAEGAAGASAIGTDLGSALASTADTVAGGAELFGGAEQFAGMAGSFVPETASALAPSFGSASNLFSSESILPSLSSSGMEALAGETAGSLARPLAETAAGGSTGFLDKTSNWIEKNPLVAMAGMGAISGGANAQAMEEERDWREKQNERGYAEDAKRYDREHQTIDPNDVTKLSDVNKRLSEGGYKSQYQKLMDQGYTPMYKGPVLPNYARMLKPEEQQP